MFSLLIALPTVGAGPLSFTPTYFELRGEAAQSDPSVGLEPGSRGYVFAIVEYCYGGPGVNLDGEIHVSVQAAEWPEWVLIDEDANDLTFSPRTVQLAASTHCRVEHVPLSVEIAADAPAGADGTIQIVAEVDEQGDLGTYQSVEGTYAAEIPIAVAE